MKTNNQKASQTAQFPPVKGNVAKGNLTPKAKASQTPTAKVAPGVSKDAPQKQEAKVPPTSMVQVQVAKASEVKGSGAKAPEVKASEVKVPDAKTPEAKVSEVKMPEVKAPEVKTPEANEERHPLSAGDSFKGKKPRAFVLDSERIEVRNWCEIPVKLLKRLSEDKEILDKLLSQRDKIAGRKRKLLSADREGMHSPKAITSEIFLETHFSTAGTMRMTLAVLDALNYDANRVRVEVVA